MASASKAEARTDRARAESDTVLIKRENIPRDFALLQPLERRLDYPSRHGSRIARLRRRFACSSPMNSSFTGSHFSERPSL